MKKEEILEKHGFPYEIFVERPKEHQYLTEAMQEYSDQENERLKAIVSKYDEIFDCQNNFPPITCSVSEIEKWQYKLSKLKSELAKLKVQSPDQSVKDTITTSDLKDIDQARDDYYKRR